MLSKRKADYGNENGQRSLFLVLIDERIEAPGDDIEFANFDIIFLKHLL